MLQVRRCPPRSTCASCSRGCSAVTWRPRSAPAPSTRTAPPGGVVGVYTDDHMALRALVILSLPLAAYGGAAIGLIPVVQAEVAVDDGVLPENLYENIAEVLNVAVSLFNRDDAPHVKLYQAFQPGEALPGDVAKWVLAFVRRLDMELTSPATARAGSRSWRCSRTSRPPRAGAGRSAARQCVGW